MVGATVAAPAHGTKKIAMAVSQTAPANSAGRMAVDGSAGLVRLGRRVRLPEPVFLFAPRTAPENNVVLTPAVDRAVHATIKTSAPMTRASMGCACTHSTRFPALMETPARPTINARQAHASANPSVVQTTKIPAPRKVA